MKFFGRIAALAALVVTPVLAQTFQGQLTLTNTPSATSQCPLSTAVGTNSAAWGSCGGSSGVTWPTLGTVVISPGATGNPTGITIAGDGTLNTSSGALVVTKTNGTAFGALATLGVGTGLGSSGGNLNLQAASSSTLGGVQGDGATLSISSPGVISLNLGNANTWSAKQLVSGAAFGLTGNQSASGIFGTSGIRYANVAGTLNDTTASGTVTTNYDSIFGGNTLTANSAVTITNDYGSYFKAPVCSTNVTCTHNYALGVDSFYDAGGATFGGAISGVTTLTASNDIYIPSGTTYGLSTNTGTQDALVTMQAGYGNANFGIGNLQSGDAVVFSRSGNGIEIQNMGYSGAYMLQAGAPVAAGGSVGLAYVNSTTLEITTSASSFNASGTIEAATGLFGGVSQTDSCTVCGTIGYLSGNLYEAATTASTSYTTGAIVDSGGLGVAGNIYVGGNLSGTGTVGSTSSYLFATTAAKPNILIGIGGSNYGQIGNVGAHSWFAGFGGSTSIIGTTDVVWFDNGDVNIGNSTAIATSATGGFFGLPTSNGAPTGTPTNAAAGVSQCEINYASQNLNCYINGGWYHVAMTSGAN